MTEGTARGGRRPSGLSRLDFLISIAAVFISAASVGIAIQNGRTERDLVAASSWPFLQVSKSAAYDSLGDADLAIANVGVGPAKIVSFTIFYDGNPVATGADLLRVCCGLSSDATAAARQIGDGAHYTTINETVLRAGADEPVMLVRNTLHMPHLHATFVAALHRLTFQACYCSVLDQCWASDLKNVEAHSVKVCPKVPRPFDSDGGWPATRPITAVESGRAVHSGRRAR